MKDPKSQDVHVGESIVLEWPYEVESKDLSADFLWSKNGKVLYSDGNMTINTNSGQQYFLSHDKKKLSIRNVSIAENAEFRCQLSVGGKKNSTGLKLRVLVPPTAVKILSYDNGSVINVEEDSLLNLSCGAYYSNPEAKVRWWYWNGKDYSKVDESAIESVISLNENSTYNSFSQLNWVAKKPDNQRTFICKAVYRNHSYSQSVILNVTYLSSIPVVHVSKSNVIAGDNVTLSCSVRGGNPLPELKWYNGSRELSGDFFFDPAENETRVEYSMIASAFHNGMKYKCRSSSGAKYKETSLIVSVGYPPSVVSITGDTIVHLNHTANFTCLTETSNPSPSIEWRVNGLSPAENASTFEQGTKTVSILSVIGTELRFGKHKMDLKCIAKNYYGEAETERSITIYSPPGDPVIKSMDANLAVNAEVSFICKADSGYPYTNISWYLSGNKLRNVSTTEMENQVKSVVSLKLEKDMNRKILRCKAVNERMNTSTCAEYSLDVSFGPDQIKVRNPQALKAGVLATLDCYVYSSNPRAEVTWEFPGELKYNATIKEKNLGSNGFDVVSSVKFMPTKEMDNVTVTCHASSSKWPKVDSSTVLDVQYSPVIENVTKEYTAKEGDSFNATVSIQANPFTLDYYWRKDNTPFYEHVGSLTAKGSSLTSKRLLKNDTGVYEMLVKNDVGNASVSFYLVVQYGANINKVSGETSVSLKEKVILSCSAEGIPNYPNMINWYHDSKLISQGVAGDNRHKNLSFIASDRMNGKFDCIADNGIGRSERTVRVLVKMKPRIYKGSRFYRAAGVVGNGVTLSCRARGHPHVKFLWYDDKSSEIKSNNGLYMINVDSKNYPDYESKLVIKKLHKGHYNQSFKCVAENSLGKDMMVIKIEPPSHPDVPSDLVCLDTTKNSVTLKWEPGFDGGSKQKFELRLLSSGGNFDRLFSTAEESIILSNLSSAEQYEVAIRSRNEDGYVSAYSSYITVFTRNLKGEDVSTVIQRANSFSTLLVLLLGVGVLLLLFINCVLFCYMHKRQKRKKIQEKTEMVRKLPDGSGDTKVVHMYGALMNSEGGCRSESVNTNRSELAYERASEDEQSMRTIIEVNPNGCMEEMTRNGYYSRDIDGYDFEHTSDLARSGIVRRNPMNRAAGLFTESYGEDMSLGASSTSYSPGIISRRSVDAPLLGSPGRQRILRNKDLFHGSNLQSAGGGLMSTFVKAESEALITVPFNYATNIDGDLV
uniref:B-cell receptor CD22-like n=1 Tax=Syphacia muris TaxID=451379 RepID=A0A0N5AIT5_9BILA